MIAVLSGDATLAALSPSILRPYQAEADDPPPLVFVGSLSSQYPEDMEGTSFLDVDMCVLIETSMDDDADSSALHDILAACRSCLTLSAIAAAMAAFADISIRGLAWGQTDIDHDGDEHRRRARLEVTVQCHTQ